MTPKGSRPVLRGLVGRNAHPATQLIDFVDEALYGFLPVENTRGQFPGPIPGKRLGSFAILKARCLRIIENR
jgi:hypothetical protein